MSGATSFAEGPGIFISEINYAGSVSSGGCKTNPDLKRCAWDKWVEISNPGNSLVDLNGYKLLFRAGVGTNEQFVFPAGANIASRSSIVVGYTETGFVSLLTQNGGADYVSFSVLRLSNKESQTLGVSLVDKNGLEIDSARMNTAGFGITGGKSIEKVGGAWQVSGAEFALGNAGSPGRYDFGSAIVESIPETMAPIPILAPIPEPALVTVITPVQTTQAVPQVEAPPIFTPVITAPVVVQITPAELQNIIPDTSVNTPIQFITATTSPEPVLSNLVTSTASAPKSTSDNFVSPVINPVFNANTTSFAPILSVSPIIPMTLQAPIWSPDSIIFKQNTTELAQASVEKKVMFESKEQNTSTPYADQNMAITKDIITLPSPLVLTSNNINVASTVNSINPTSPIAIFTMDQIVLLAIFSISRVGYAKIKQYRSVTR